MRGASVCAPGVSNGWRFLSNKMRGLPLGAPPAVHVAATHPPPVTRAPALDRDKVNQLGRLHKSSLPGNILASIGFPILFVASLLCMFLPLFAVIDGGESALRTATNQIDNKPSSQEAGRGASLGGCACFCVVFLLAGGSVGLVLARKKLNADFTRRNTVRLNYSLPHEKAICYKTLLRCLDVACPG